MNIFYIITISLLWWVPPIISAKWLDINVFGDKFFITFSFVVFFLLIIKFTSIKVQIPGISINTDKLGRLFKMSQNKNGASKSYEFYYDTEQEFKKLVKYFKDIIE
jgi:hypothetical protein